MTTESAAPGAVRAGSPGTAWAAAVLLACTIPAAAAPPTSTATRLDCDRPADVQQRLHPAASAAPAHARAVWLDATTLRWPGTREGGRFRLHHARDGGIAAESGRPVRGADGAIVMSPRTGVLATALAERFAHVAPGVELVVDGDDRAALKALHRGELVLVHEDDAGRVRDATRVQAAAALDALYPDAPASPPLGVGIADGATTFRVWAPTARALALCLHRDDAEPAEALVAARRDDATGVWEARVARPLAGRYYTWLVDVFVPGTGVVRNRVTDPYASSLGADSRRAYVADLRDPALAPEGWGGPAPARVAASTDLVIYELHVRDFSIGDATVPAAHRGKYLAFTAPRSDGMRHLRALAAAGVTDVHLLPVFDLASVPERGCVTPSPSGPSDGESQQAAVAAVKDRDCFNWGYDPWHYTAPEGSYATDASDGASRILEFRRMVQALHDAGLRVGMDVVYNHTTASGQHPKSVLDRIVPGYYHRLDADGAVATSTCCANTATEHAMMERLMIDSVVAWAREHAIDSFRFDLMGHQPRAAMLRLQAAVNAATGRDIHLLGEGWNFGEVADGARFVQASQRSLAGTGIATFSDRARDALRGGSAGDADARQVALQGWLNGLHYAPNALAPRGADATALLRAADLARVGLAGSLRDYVLEDHRGRRVALAGIDYNGQPAGYVAAPGEVVNYVENHDNQTLFDLNAFKLPLDTSREDRARVQLLGAATVAFSQGIAYFHAGIETLRSKSMDRNSYDSGDWFNRLDWTLRDNGFGAGLPPRQDNAASWPLMKPRLADPRIKPTAAEIRWMRDAFLDLLRIRASTTLLRLRSAADVSKRLRLPNTGPDQVPTVLAGRLDGDGLEGARFGTLLYFINADLVPHVLELAGERGKPYVLHPVHRAVDAADRRPADAARYDAATGRFTVPARTAVSFVVE